MVDDCLGFIEAEARKHRIRVETHVPDLPPIPADRLMLEQVLLNLMRNGMEAMSDNTEASRLLVVRVDIGENELSVSVADQGCGHCTRKPGEALYRLLHHQTGWYGYRLSICRSIIEFHRGRLWADDNPRSSTGRGTIFTFTLPMEST